MSDFAMVHVKQMHVGAMPFVLYELGLYELYDCEKVPELY